MGAPLASRRGEMALGAERDPSTAVHARGLGRDLGPVRRGDGPRVAVRPRPDQGVPGRQGRRRAARLRRLVARVRARGARRALHAAAVVVAAVGGPLAHRLHRDHDPPAARHEADHPRVLRRGDERGGRRSPGARGVRRVLCGGPGSGAAGEEAGVHDRVRLGAALRVSRKGDPRCRVPERGGGSSHGPGGSGFERKQIVASRRATIRALGSRDSSDWNGMVLLSAYSS